MTIQGPTQPASFTDPPEVDRCPRCEGDIETDDFGGRKCIGHCSTCDGEVAITICPRCDGLTVGCGYESAGRDPDAGRDER